MATIAADINTTRLNSDPQFTGVVTVQWPNLANLDGGSAVQLPRFADRTVQVSGTFGVGGTAVIEGSIDGVNYVTLTDPQGNALTFTADSIESIAEAVLFLRPRVTAGDGTTSLTFDLLAREGAR